ncbi:hypothetical protein Q9L58_006840 [Maublancomyces gigas]|uniref:MARVEL domain-containing protein n=1 Tax=Discina gigas TaxID=1032678 RepID=A0ABR3GEJ2_9PEZI
MTRDKRWPAIPFVGIRIAQLILAFAAAVLASSFKDPLNLWVYGTALSGATIIYTITNIICFSIGWLNPSAVLYLDFLFFLLWTFARVMATISRSHLEWMYINAAVIVLEFVLFMPTTAIAAIVVYRMRNIHDGNQAVAWDLPVHRGSAQPVMWNGQGPLQSQNPVISEVGGHGYIPAHFQEMPAAR